MLVCECDTCTQVEFTDNGRLEIMGWDGTEGIGDYAEKFSAKDIDKLYKAMIDMAA